MKKLLLKISIPLIVLLTFAGIFAVLYYPLINDRARRYLEKEFQKAIGQSVQLKSLSLGVTGFKLGHFSVVDDSNRFSLRLREVRVQLNPFKVLFGQFGPLKLVRSVSFHQPTLVLYQAPATEVSSPPDFARILERFVFAFQELSSIDQIRIEQGQILWQWQNGKQRALLTGLIGNLYILPNRIARFQLSGNFLNARQSDIVFAGTLDFGHGNLGARLLLNECTLDDQVPFFSNGIYQLEQARLSGEIQIASRLEEAPEMEFQGQLQMQDVQFRIFDQLVRARAVQLRLQGQDIHIEPFPASIEGAPAQFGGVIYHVTNPTVHWQLAFKDYPAVALKKAHSIFRHIEEGKIQGQATFTGPLNKMRIDVQASSPFIQFAVVPFRRISTRFTFKENQFYFQSAQAWFKQFRTTGSGRINLNNNELYFRLNSSLHIPEQFFRLLDRLDGSDVSIQTVLHGKTDRQIYRGRWQYQVVKQTDSLLAGEGEFRLRGEQLRYALHSVHARDSLSLQGVVEELFTSPRFRIAEVKNIPVHNFTSNALLADLARSCRIDAYIAGPYEYLLGRIHFFSPDRHRKFATLTSNIREIFTEHQRLDFSLHANTIPKALDGKVRLHYQPERVEIQVHFPELARGSILLGSLPEDSLEGYIQIEPFSVLDYLQGDPQLSRLIQEGFLKGQVTFSGTVAQPTIHFALEASDFILNRVGYYQTQLKGQLSGRILSVEDSWVKLNGTPVFLARLAYNLENQFINLHVRGKELESNFLAETLFGDRSLIQGTASYQMQISGKLPRPNIGGEVSLRQGLFSGTPFDFIGLTFRDSIPPGASLTDLQQHILKIDHFIYLNRKEYTIEARGEIGLGAQGVLDLELNAFGNVLAELPKLEPYFQNPRSNGTLQLKIGGTRNDPVFQQALLKVSDGSLSFDGVIPTVENLQIEARLEEGSDFVHIQRLEGTLQGRRARIYNVPEVSLSDGTTLAPVELPFLGLSFGVLILETDPRGIPLSIPGLMYPQEIGYFAAEGKTATEKFYFSGPIESPTVRGKIRLYDSRVTFPFLGMEEEFYGDKSEETSIAATTENPVIEYLLGVRWDVLVVPGNNNRYFVNIPAYVGKVHLDLNIDNNSPGLEFTGRLNDETFRIVGSVTSSRGRVDYLDVNFKVENFGVHFNPFELYPEVWGKAFTTVRDTTGIPKDIYLVLYAIDPETGQEVSRGHWENFRFKLVSSDPAIGETQEQVLAYLGYNLEDLESIRNKAEEVGLSMTENLLIRPLVRPLERRLERELGLDYVRFRSNIATNFYYLTFPDRARLLQNPFLFGQALNNNLNPALLLLQSSEVTVGKYLARNIYLTYTGSLVSLFDEARLGLNHKFGLEYRLLSNILLDLEFENYQLNSLLYNRNQLNDFRIRLRHSFNF